MTSYRRYPVYWDLLVKQTILAVIAYLWFFGSEAIAAVLRKCPLLQHLDVGDTDQSLSGIQHILAEIRPFYGDHQNLRVLNLSRIIPISKLYQYDGEHLAIALSEMLQANTTLRELHIQKNELYGHEIELLLSGLTRNATLLFLDLGYNRIGDHGIELIANWLKKRPALLALNVAGNRIGNTGSRALSFGMPFSKIRLLDISNNNIADEGMLDILNSIKKPYMLRLFYIWGNKIKQKTFKVLERMLLSGVLNQEQIDVKLYTVDEVLYIAYYPTNHYKHRYYCVMDHGCPVELRIKRNIVDSEYAEPRALVDFENYDRFPEIDYTLTPRKPPCADQYDNLEEI